MAAGGTDTWLCQLQCPLASCLPVELSTGCEVPASLGAACVFLCVLQNSELQAQKFGSLLLHSWALFLPPSEVCSELEMFLWSSRLYGGGWPC